MNTNDFIDLAGQVSRTQQQQAMVQDNLSKTAFALKMIERLPKEPPKPEEPPRIPSLGALAIPN